MLIPKEEHGLLDVEGDGIVGDSLELDELNDVEVAMFLLEEVKSFLQPLVSDEDFRRNRTSGGTDLILS